MYNQKPLLGTLPNFAHPLVPTAGAWLFNENSGNNVFDLSGNGNHGSFGAGAAAPTWVLGRTGPALDFDNIDDYIDCGTNSCFNFSQTNKVSFEMLIKPNSITDATVHALIGNINMHRILQQNANLYIRYHNTLGAEQIATFANALTVADTWHHFIGTINDNVVSCYINGTEHSSSPITKTGTIQTGNHHIYIGMQDGSSYPFNGAIDKFAIYNRALSASEIWQLYVNPYGWLAQPMEAELMYAAPPIGVMSPYYYEQLMAGVVI